MWPFSRLREHRYCAFCKVLRRVYVKKHIDATNVLGTVLLSLVSTYALWEGPDPRGLVLFSVLIMGSEVFVYARWRVQIVCKLCGFDPVLYKKSVPQASERVKEFFKEQVENPEFWLTKSPLLMVQKHIRAHERAEVQRVARAKRVEVADAVAVAVAAKKPAPLAKVLRQ